MKSIPGSGFGRVDGEDLVRHAAGREAEPHGEADQHVAENAAGEGLERAQRQLGAGDLLGRLAQGTGEKA